jgi:uncharacterized protein (TIGR02996 family)
MTDDEAALRAAIVAAPDDDAPRLVLADLLTARGDPHGELIVLMCRIAAGDDNRDQLQKRVDALLAVGWKAYAGELAPYASPDAFARGLVERVRMTVTVFAKQGAQLLRRHPLRVVAITLPASGKLDPAKLARVEKVFLELPSTHPLREVTVPGGGSAELRTRFPR